MFALRHWLYPRYCRIQGGVRLRTDRVRIPRLGKLTSVAAEDTENSEADDQVRVREILDDLRRLCQKTTWDTSGGTP